MKKFTSYVITAVGGTILGLVLQLFFSVPPSRAEFDVLKTRVDSMHKDISIIKTDVKTLLKKVD